MPELPRPEQSVPGKAPLTLGGWAVIVTLGAILGGAIWLAFYGWNLTDAVVSTPGIISLVLGVVLSLVLGGGLMALVFYSSRKGYDR